MGDEEGYSFYTTRRAEYALKNGQTAEACKLIDQAVAKTPNIFSVRALRGEIYLEAGNKAIASEELSHLEAIVNRNSAGERRSNLRVFLVFKANYLSAIADFNGAKEIYKVADVFTPAEAAKGIKDVEYEQSFRRKR